MSGFDILCSDDEIVWHILASHESFPRSNHVSATLKPPLSNASKKSQPTQRLGGWTREPSSLALQSRLGAHSNTSQALSRTLQDESATTMILHCRHLTSAGIASAHTRVRSRNLRVPSKGKTKPKRNRNEIQAPRSFSLVQVRRGNPPALA